MHFSKSRMRILPVGLIVLVSLHLTACGDKGTDAVDCQVEGITERDANGQVAGAQDPDDWRIGGAEPQLLAEVYAYPNPFDPGSSNCLIAVRSTATGDVSISIRGSDCAALALLADEIQVEPGLTYVEWGGSDGNGTRLPNGLYRVLVTFSSGAGAWTTYGDVQIQRD